MTFPAIVTVTDVVSKPQFFFESDKRLRIGLSENNVSYKNNNSLMLLTSHRLWFQFIIIITKIMSVSTTTTSNSITSYTQLMM